MSQPAKHCPTCTCPNQTISQYSDVVTTPGNAVPTLGSQFLPYCAYCKALVAHFCHRTVP